MLPWPKLALVTAWLTLTTVAYYLLIFTEWGNYDHGGGPLDKVLLDAVVVLAAYLCFELFRSEKKIFPRVLSALLGLPLAAFIFFSLWYALKFIASA